MKKLLERDIQDTICEFLTLEKIFFWRSNNTPIFDATKKVFRRMPKYARKGVPDITLIHQGEVKFIEVKRKGAKQSPEQLEFEKACKSHGITYILAYGLEEVMRGI